MRRTVIRRSIVRISLLTFSVIESRGDFFAEYLFLFLCIKLIYLLLVCKSSMDTVIPPPCSIK